MKVSCIKNSLKSIPSNVYEGLQGYSVETEFSELEIGQQFVVYGINTFKKYPWYLIKVEGLAYPMYYPAHLFKIIDGRLSKHWIVQEGQDDYDNEVQILEIGFKELVENKFFYGELIEDNSANNAIFNKYKALLDVEFPDNNNPLVAELIDKNWVMCPVCSDAFEANIYEGIVLCSKCKTSMNNPCWYGFEDRRRK